MIHTKSCMYMLGEIPRREVHKDDEKVEENFASRAVVLPRSRRLIAT